MIPKEIDLQLVRLKDKVKTYSSIQRSLDISERRDKVDEIKAKVQNVNDAIADLSMKTDNILQDGLISNFEIEDWFEDMKDKTIFSEPNPKLVYEEEQRELERQRKVAKDNENQEIERQRKLAEETKRNLERQREIAKEREKQKLEEIERQKKFEEEKAKREAEEHLKRLQIHRIEEFKNMCQNGGEDINKLKKFINEGLDINKINDFDCLESCISWRKSLPFIQFLVDAGILVKNKHIEYCYSNLKNIENSTSIISILEKAKNIDNEAVANILKRKRAKTNQIIIGVILTVVIIALFYLFSEEIMGFLKILIMILILPFLLPVLLKKR